jgi:hypothetical protein
MKTKRAWFITARLVFSNGEVLPREGNIMAVQGPPEAITALVAEAHVEATESPDQMILKAFGDRPVDLIGNVRVLFAEHGWELPPELVDRFLEAMSARH